MLKLEIFLDPNDGDLQTSLATHMAALGFVPISYVNGRDIDPWGSKKTPPEPATQTVNLTEVLRSADAPVSDAVKTEAPEISTESTEPPARRRRRTKEEIARDEAAGKEPAQALISTGEPRVDPEDAKQDAADEAAEQQTNREPGKLTLEDVRGAVQRFTAKFGIARAAKEVPAILGCNILEIPNDQGAYAAAIERIEKAMNPEAASTPEEQPLFEQAPPATKQDVIAALTAYGEKFDGAKPGPGVKCPNLMTDGPALLERACGVKAVPMIPDDPNVYAAVVRMIRTAIEQNPFNRTVHK